MNEFTFWMLLGGCAVLAIVMAVWGSPQGGNWTGPK